MGTIRDLQFSKTSQVFSVPITAKTSGSSLKNSSKSSNRAPRCLRCHVADGPTPTVTWETDGVLLTVLLIHSTGVKPSETQLQALLPKGVHLNDAEDCTLQHVLQANAPTKYYLSEKACRGIIRRAKARGKELPAMLEAALFQMIETETPS